MRRSAIRPNRELGQNFLIDSNLLDVIARAAELGPDDVVLEVGGGLGVLSEHLAERARHVHVVELDRRLEPPLRDALDPHANVTLHFADAVKLDLAALDPAPTKVVANLPYGVAATVILRTIERAAGASTTLGGDGAARGRRALRRRARARPPTACRRVLAQLACDVRVLRPVSRTRLPSRCRTSTPCSSASTRRGAAPRAAAARARPAGLRAPPQGARALAGARARRGDRDASAPRSRRSAARPTRAPRRSRRRSGAQLHARRLAMRLRCARPRQGQPLPVRRRAARATACTRSCRSSSRSRSPTS